MTDAIEVGQGQYPTPAPDATYFKAIVYTIKSSGVDGLAPPKVIFATFNEAERDTVFNNAKNKNTYSKGEQIVETIQARKDALASLDGIQRLALGLEQRQLPTIQNKEGAKTRTRGDN